MRKLVPTLLLLGLAPAAAAADRAGVSAAVRGEVRRTASTAGEVVGGRFKGGESVFMGDGIESGAQSGMQLLLIDQTTFTIGPDSRLTIDEFVYDPKAGAGKVGATIVRGGFRFVSGKIAANRPSDMVVKTPVATIGVRGTAVFGVVTPAETVIALAGPGRNNNTRDKAAGVDVLTPFGNTELRRAGFAARILPGQPPELIRITPELLRRLEGGLGPTGSSSTSGPSTARAAQSIAPAAGGSTAQGGIGNVATIGALGGNDLGRALETLQGIETTGTYLASSETRQSDPAGAQLGEATDVQNVSFAIDYGNFTTYGDLLSITAGTGTFSQTGVAMVGTGASGSYDFSLTIDFGAQTISGGFSNINVSGTLTVTGGSIPLSQAYNAGIAQVPAFLSNVVTCGGGYTCSGVALLSNSNGVIAGAADHAVVITDNTNVAVGAATATRSP